MRRKIQQGLFILETAIIMMIVLPLLIVAYDIAHLLQDGIAVKQLVHRLATNGTDQPLYSVSPLTSSLQTSGFSLELDTIANAAHDEVLKILSDCESTDCPDRYRIETRFVEVAIDPATGVADGIVCVPNGRSRKKVCSASEYQAAQISRNTQHTRIVGNQKLEDTPFDVRRLFSELGDLVYGANQEGPFSHSVPTVYTKALETDTVGNRDRFLSSTIVLGISVEIDTTSSYADRLLAASMGQDRLIVSASAVVAPRHRRK